MGLLLRARDDRSLGLRALIAVPDSKTRRRLIRAVQAVAFVAVIAFVWRSGSFSDGGILDGVTNQARHSPDVALGYSLAPGRVHGGDRRGRHLDPVALRQSDHSPVGDISYGIFLVARDPDLLREGSASIFRRTATSVPFWLGGGDRSRRDPLRLPVRRFVEQPIQALGAEVRSQIRRRQRATGRGGFPHAGATR